MVSRAIAILSFAGWLFQAQAVEVAATAKITPGPAQVLKLVQSGVAEDVIMAFVENSTLPKPTADDVVQLHAAGVSDRVLLALLAKKPVAAQPAPAANAQQNNGSAPAQPVEAPAPVPPQTIVYVQRPPAVFVQPAPVVAFAPSFYSYPSFGCYRWPSVSFAFGFGRGFGPRFSGHHFGGFSGHHHGGLHFRRF